MRKTVRIENIEEMRRRAGIDDIELRDEIRQLRAGDLVRLTFLTGPNSFEMLALRITSIRGPVFRGKLVEEPSASGRLGLHVGSLLAFTTEHIHSIPNSHPAEEQ
jgi:hypothetical protein